MPPPQQLLSSSVSFKCLNFYLKVYPSFLFILIAALIPRSAPSISSSYKYFNSTKICIEGEPWPDGNFCFALKNSTLLNESAQRELTKRQGMAVEMFCDMVRILTKIDCSQPYSVHVRHNQCGQCQDAYRDWVCSVIVESIEDTYGDVISYHSSMPFRSCDSVCNHVLRVCPYLSPDRVQVGPSGNASLHPSQYGGHPAFYCPTRLSPLQELRQRLEHQQHAGAIHHLLFGDEHYHHSSLTSSSLLPSIHDDNNNNNNNYLNKLTNNNHNNNQNNNNNNLNNGMSIQYSYFYRRGNEVNLTDELFTSNETACCWTYSRALRSERISEGIHLPDDDDDYEDTFPLLLLENPKNYIQLQCVQATITYNSPTTSQKEAVEDFEAEEEDEGGAGRIGGDDLADNPTNAQPHHNSFDDRTLSKFIIDFDTEPGVSDVYDYVELANGATSSTGQNTVSNNGVSKSTSFSDDSTSGSGITSSGSSNNNNRHDNEPLTKGAPVKGPFSVPRTQRGQGDIDLVDIESPQVIHHSSHASSGSDHSDRSDLRRANVDRPKSAIFDHHHHHRDRVNLADHSAGADSDGGAQSPTFYIKEGWFQQTPDGESSSNSNGKFGHKAMSKSIQKRNNYLLKNYAGLDSSRRANVPTTKSVGRVKGSSRTRQEHLQLPQSSERESLLSSAGTSGETLDNVDEQDIDVEDLLYNTGAILEDDDTAIKAPHHHHHHHRDSSKDETLSESKGSGDDHRSKSSARFDRSYSHQRHLFEHRPIEYVGDNVFDESSSVARSERSTPTISRESQELHASPSWLSSMSRLTTSIPFAKSSAGRLTPIIGNIKGTLGWDAAGRGKSGNEQELSLLPPLILITCLVNSIMLIFARLFRTVDLYVKSGSAANNFLSQTARQVSSSSRTVLSVCIMSFYFLFGFMREVCLKHLKCFLDTSPPSWESSPLHVVYVSPLPVPRLSWVGRRAWHGDDDDGDDEERRWDKTRRGKRQMTITSSHIRYGFIATTLPANAPARTYVIYFFSLLRRYKSRLRSCESLRNKYCKTNYHEHGANYSVTGRIIRRSWQCPTTSYSSKNFLHLNLHRITHHYFQLDSLIRTPVARITVYRLPTMGNHNSLSTFYLSASSTSTLASGFCVYSTTYVKFSGFSARNLAWRMNRLQPSPASRFLKLATLCLTCSIECSSDFFHGEKTPQSETAAAFKSINDNTPCLLNGLTVLDKNMVVNECKGPKDVPVQLPRILWMTNNTIIVVISTIFKFNTVCLMGWRSGVLLILLLLLRLPLPAHKLSLGALVNSDAVPSPEIHPVVQHPRLAQQNQEQQQQRRRHLRTQSSTFNLYFNCRPRCQQCYHLPVPFLPLHYRADVHSEPALVLQTAIHSEEKAFQLIYQHEFLSFLINLVLDRVVENLKFHWGCFLLKPTFVFVLYSTFTTAKIVVIRLTAILLCRLLLLPLLTRLLHISPSSGRAGEFPKHSNHLGGSRSGWTANLLRNCHSPTSGFSGCCCSYWKRYFKTSCGVW